ncbi:2-oxoglutarate and iron-dependent oxygenase domain-containing protein [Roseomonas sp. E05]|uniref:isopenicillin N synthase family dioxygenase n=1 Tax=Roseomonas sp. E05 TaxID=3046310 RepID=UPI0024BAB40A|nr:2-oxoglutarate and iron-dependent oxygenase domain-containing protein [Roseomonas sp. E05]MDJ0388762.1 2-oxoglutarate and iron-dependent oxygenase domain-containing protein [Roseomonas sp. E05]
MSETMTPPRPATADEVPVIDMSPALVPGADLTAIAQTVRKACQGMAFFYVKNHGIDQAVIDGTFQQMQRFFSLPLEERMKIVKDRFHRGYLPIGTTRYPGKLPDLKDSFDLGLDLSLDDEEVIAGTPLHGPNQWPDLPGFREAVEAYFDAVRELGMRVLRVLAVSLGVEEDYFVRFYSKPTILTRLIHYPAPEAVADPEFGIGALDHTDYGLITLLYQDPAGGLELKKPDGEWVAAPFIPGTFVVNLGDLMARWTNDVYRSNPHRVVNRLGRDRFSIPTFFNPNHRAPVEAIPTCVTPDNPAKYEPVLAGEYVTGRIRANQGYKPPQATA